MTAAATQISKTDRHDAGLHEIGAVAADPLAAESAPAAPATPEVDESLPVADGPLPEVVASAAPSPNAPAPSKLRSFLAPFVEVWSFSVRAAHSLWTLVDRMIDSAAGYDEKVLAQYGSPTDEKRRRNIGRAILVATAVGALGWFAKIMMGFPGPFGFPIAVLIAFLYGVLSYSLESFFASNVDPYASLASKLFSLFGRTMLSCVIAFSAALPWVTIALKASVHLEMTKIALAEHDALRKSIDSTYNLAGIQAKASDFQKEAATWTSAAVTLPSAIQQALDQAQSCADSYDRSKDEGDKRTATLQARLPVLSKMESAQNVTAATRQAVEVERGRINAQLFKIAKDLYAKRGECETKKHDSEAARDSHLNFANQERMSSQKRLAQLRQDEGEVDAKVRAERSKVEQVVKDTSQANSSAEFSALLSIIKRELYAQLISGLIFLGLLLIDVLPLTLRLFSRPGPYDAEKRADDEIKVMRASGRLMEAKMMHEARRTEMESDDLKKLVQAECRPHIRSIALRGVERFLSKQPKT